MESHCSLSLLMYDQTIVGLGEDDDSFLNILALNIYSKVSLCVCVCILTCVT